MSVISPNKIYFPFSRFDQNLVEDVKTRMRTFLRWRRNAQPAVPQTLAELDESIRQPENARYKDTVAEQPFYRGLIGQHSILFMGETCKGYVKLAFQFYQNSKYIFRSCLQIFFNFRTLEVENTTLNIDATFSAVPYIGEAKQTLVIMARTDDEVRFT